MREQARFRSLKTIGARVLCTPWLGRAIGAVWGDRIPHRGCRIDLRRAEVPATLKASLFWGLYESAEVRFVRDYLRPDLDVLELGSSLGVVASHIARRLERGRKLVCVEANPNLIAALRDNVTTHAGDTEIHIVAGAVRYSNTGGLTVERNPLGSRLAEEEAAATETAEHVAAVTLGELRRRFFAGPYQLVMDIEGAEAGLVVRERDALKPCRRLILECHRTRFEGRDYDVQTLIELIHRLHGFELVDRYGPVCFFDKLSGETR